MNRKRVIKSGRGYILVCRNSKECIYIWKTGRQKRKEKKRTATYVVEIGIVGGVVEHSGHGRDVQTEEPTADTCECTDDVRIRRDPCVVLCAPTTTQFTTDPSTMSAFIQPPTCHPRYRQPTFKKDNISQYVIYKKNWHDQRSVDSRL